MSFPLSTLWSMPGRDAVAHEVSRTVNRLVPRQRSASELDPLALWSTLGLMLLGLVMVYSASIALAGGSSFTNRQDDYFLLRHATFLVIGVLAALAAFRLSMATWRMTAPWLVVGGIVLLVIVLIPEIGREVNGAKRWIPLGPVNLQPSEFMKVFAAIYAADYAERKLKRLSSFRQGFLPMSLAVMLVSALLLLEPDFGATVVVASIAFGILFIGGVSLRLFLGLIVAALAAMAALILLSPYRRERLFNFTDPWADPLASGYQLSHALIAFGRGEWFGVGLGASVEKLFYLPEAHTDFLLAVIGEELGFVGVAVVVALFAVLVQRAFAIGRAALARDDRFAGLLAQGIGLWIGVQAFFNMGVNLGILPTKGLTLPLMSYGGSAIVATCVALGILFRIDWDNRSQTGGGR